MGELPQRGQLLFGDGQQAVKNCIMNCIVHHLFLFGFVTLSHSTDDYYDFSCL